jgi:competence protein ComEA
LWKELAVDEERRDGAGWRGLTASPRLIAAAACFVLGAAVLAVGLLPRLAPPPPPAAALGDPGDPGDVGDLGGPLGPAADDAPAELIVYVTGAVAAPDVYRLPAGARVKDAVLAAGGLRDDAAAERLNLAAALDDAQHIHVPARAEGGPAAEVAGGGDGDGRLDLNRASESDLEELPGVGTVLAERIVARREEQGPFASVEDLRDVAGVGPRLFEQIAPLLTAGR